MELAKQLYFQQQEPFDLPDSNLLRELSKCEDGENQYEALDHSLGISDPDPLQGVLYEFIETYVKNSQPQEYHLP